MKTIKLSLQHRKNFHQKDLKAQFVVYMSSRYNLLRDSYISSTTKIVLKRI